MFNCLADFKNNIDDLIHYLNIEEQKEIFFRDLLDSTDVDSVFYKKIRSHIDSVVRPSSTLAKEFTYSNSIITLYGYLESFLEKLVEEFIFHINELSIPIARLPNAIRERHLELSMQFLASLTRGRAKDDEKKRKYEIEVISNLHSVMQENEKYVLNSKAFSVHTANFRYDLIQSFFAQIGIEKIADRTLGCDKVKVFLSNRQQQELTSDKAVLKSWLEYELGDLAQLRNEIAHGAFEGTIESVELTIARANFLQSFGIALASILEKTIEEIKFNEINRFILGPADNTFPRHSAFGFIGKEITSQTKQFFITVGDTLFAKNESYFASGRVLSLFIDGRSVDRVLFPSPTDFSIGVDFAVRNNMTNVEVSVSK